jgi:hypothetical protein
VNGNERTGMGGNGNEKLIPAHLYFGWEIEGVGRTRHLTELVALCISRKTSSCCVRQAEFQRQQASCSLKGRRVCP